MDVIESNGKEVSLQNNIYTILKDDKSYKLKKYKIKKRPFLYAFIGGMWYSKKDFSFKMDISLPYPFSTYFTTKILDINYNNNLFRSLYYVKMPIFVIQFEDECICIEFDPVIQFKDKEFIPFISLEEDNEYYIISFYLFNNFYILEKESAWLGFSKKRKINLNLKKNDSFRFNTKVLNHENWTDAVKKFVEYNIEKNVEVCCANDVFELGKKALFRSYDHLTGSFLQLPWRESPGFSLVNFSYSLISYEAVRLHYFSKWFKQLKDQQFIDWVHGLNKIFKNPNMYKTDLKKGKGLVWYNMSNLVKNGLEGYFYMDCGYGGYPGGQGTIAFHLFNYLKYYDDHKLEVLLEKSLDYILSTQNENGSWPMAIRQEGFLGFRSEVLERYETWGGSGENIRALLEGFKRFSNDLYKNAALKALDFLDCNHPICYNGLRDIGINEPEAFSAVSIIDAFLDAYDITKNKDFLNKAEMYAYHTLSWIYFYNTKNLLLKYSFHPISYSITPRISPYESVWIVSTYKRLFRYTKDIIWDNLAKLVYKSALKWTSDHGGLCEGVFPYFLDKLKPLPMEQTFATVELLNASLNFCDFKPTKMNYKKELSIDSIIFEKKGEVLSVLYDNDEVLRFNLSECKIEFLKNCRLNNFGISFFSSEVYSILNKIKRVFKSVVRRNRLKYILSIFELKHFLKGVKGPKLKDNFKIRSIGKYVKFWDFSIDKNNVSGFCQTSLHRIEYKISIVKKDNNLHICFDPFVVKVLAHDLPIRKTFIPVIGCKFKTKSEGRIFFDNFNFMGDFKDVYLIEDVTFVDQTKKTNWTYGGIYKGRFEIILNIK